MVDHDDVQINKCYYFSALGGKWIGGGLWCSVHTYLSFVTNMVAYILLTFIALDAFILIHFPFRYR